MNGIFVAGKDMDASNYVEMRVHVAAWGSYYIGSDTVNGYSFQSSGYFKDTGLVLVKLAGFGKPQNTGSDQFHIVYGQSKCHAVVTV